MEENQKKFNLRVAEDGATVLLDCHIAADELDSLVDEISNEFEALGINGSSNKEQLREQLLYASEENPELVDFVLIEGKPVEKFNLRVTEDKLAVLLDCDVTPDELDSLVADIHNKLESLGINGPPDNKQLKKQLNAAAESNPHIRGLVLVEGETPTPPQDGKVDWVGDFFNTGFVKDKETGKINYREKVAHKSVQKNAPLGKRIETKEGKDGKDVFGEQIPTEKPETDYPEVGGNVRFSTADNNYYATVNGRVRLANNILSVNEVYSIPKDVDIKTGNVSHTGAVVVNGDVLRDSKVEADGSIEVHGVVECAEIISGGDLNVHGGIRLEEQKILVEGGIHARFINGGNIQAKHDIVVDNEIVNSNVRTLGSVTIPGGRIVGGEVIAHKGIYVGKTGSKHLIPTVLVAGEDFNFRKRISLKEGKVKKVEEELAKLQGAVNAFAGDPESLSPEAREGHATMEANVSRLKQDLNGFNKEMDDVKAKSMHKAIKLIVVEKVIYPKTTLGLGYERLTVEEDISGPIEARMAREESSGPKDTKIVNEKIELSPKTS